MGVSEKTARQVYDKYNSCCAMCYRKTDTLQIHHKEIKGMGGRKGRYKKESDSLENLILLCIVCHGAMHGENVFDSSGFSCEVCPANWACEHSQHKSDIEDVTEIKKLHVNLRSLDSTPSDVAEAMIANLEKKGIR